MATIPATPHRRASSAPRRARVIGLGAPLVLALASGCGVKDFRNENDRLRRQVVDLETQAECLVAERDELRAKLAETSRVEGAELDEAVREALPRVAGVRVGRFTGPVDIDSVRGPDAIEIYIEPFDGRRRFVQVAGSLTAEVLFLPPLAAGDSSGASASAQPGAGAEPIDRAVVELGPSALRDAFRSDLQGFRYTVRVPLPRPNELLSGPALVRIRLVDGVTGVTHTDERVIRTSMGRVTPPSASSR